MIQGNPAAVSLADSDTRDSLNLALVDVFEGKLALTIEAGYERIARIMEDAGYDFHAFPHIPQDAEEGEDIFAINEDSTYYLYVAFFLEEETGYYEFHAELVTEDELNEILSVE